LTQVRVYSRDPIERTWNPSVNVAVCAKSHGIPAIYREESTMKPVRHRSIPSGFRNSIQEKPYGIRLQ
jgi:hypothetical protein